MQHPSPADLDVVEAGIAELRAALESGRTTSVGLVRAYLARIQAVDSAGPRLNAVVVLNPEAQAEARASDERRAAGRVLSPLDGIPYTAKDSYLVRGLTAAAGSPAFAGLVAQRDAFTIERLRAGGAICLGLTNMPPMANGGMQRGLYGRAESPYSSDHLPAAFGSGSSNGSGVATAASLAAFGLAEETWSSGRAPASNNALVAYTPSRGVISVRGNWPLVPTMDVVVPHARTMADLLEVLDVVVADDGETRGDFWRVQPWIPLPAASAVRPASYRALAVRRDEAPAVLAGVRIGVPRMYIDADPLAGTAQHGGIGGPTGQRIVTRPSVLALWAAARADLEAAGATVVEVDLPAVSNYEGDRPGAPTIATRGLVPPEALRREFVDLAAWAWDDFLRANGDPALPGLAAVEGSRIAPPPPGALPDRYDGFDDDVAAYPDHVRQHPVAAMTDIPELEALVRGLDETGRVDVDEWLDREGLDALVFPAVADVGPADMDVNPASADLGWRNGVWVANGNLAIRHLGIPTVTVPMGTMADIGMPVGLTVAGRRGDDVALLRLAAAFDALGARRTAPGRTAPSRTAPSRTAPPHETSPPHDVPPRDLGGAVAPGGRTGQDRRMTWTMPHEGAPHERTWMAWPSSGYTLGDTAAEAEEARTTWAAVAHAVLRFEPVTMVVDPSAEAVARRCLSSDIPLLVAPLDDAWMRDIGPTFVRDGDTIGAVDWVFNGWGAQDWASWDRDRHIARVVAEAAGVQRIPSDLVNEGGAIHVDGEGTVLATRTVQLDPGRNPGRTEADVAAELARVLGAGTTIWLPRGLTRDSQRFGTRGHVDLVATFPEPGTVLVHRQQDPAHPDHAVSEEVAAVLRDARDAAGRALRVVEVPAPEGLRDGEGWVDHSYINHVVVNGGVVACAFGDPGDDRAAGILRDAYPDREVVTVDARPLFARGGGIHCITQQQPAR